MRLKCFFGLYFTYQLCTRQNTIIEVLDLDIVKTEILPVVVFQCYLCRLPSCQCSLEPREALADKSTMLCKSNDTSDSFSAKET